jgi:hypothetical protein
MKKLFTLIAVAGMFAFSACGPSAEEKAAMEKAKQDSIAASEKAYADSVAMAQQAMEQAKADSVNAAMAKAKQDSIDAAAAKGTKK